jgi:hypothetical protein
MRKAILILLLLAPFCLKAQEGWLGKTRCDVNIGFQDAKLPRINSDRLGSAAFTDTFQSGKYEETIVQYDDKEICTEVIKVMKTSILATTLKNFTTKYDKGKDNIFLTNVWFDKNKAFKVHIENWTGVNKFYVDYLAFDKGFVGR